MLASSAPLGVPGLLPVTLRSEKTENIVKLLGDCISRKMVVRGKKRKEMLVNKYLWDGNSFV